LAQLPTRVHALVCALDPVRWPASAGAPGPRAARRLLQLCGSASTTPTSPNPVARCGVRHRAPGSAAPLRSRRQLGFHSSGVPSALSRHWHPHVDLLRQRGFTPNRSTQTPRVAHRCHLRLGKRPQAAAGRIPVPPTTPFETLGGSARPTHLEDREGPFRVAACGSSRKETPLAAPEVPSTSRTSLSADTPIDGRPRSAAECPPLPTSK
jgi:hypothetical protein